MSKGTSRRSSHGDLNMPKSPQTSHHPANSLCMQLISECTCSVMSTVLYLSTRPVTGSSTVRKHNQSITGVCTSPVLYSVNSEVHPVHHLYCMLNRAVYLNTDESVQMLAFLKTDPERSSVYNHQCRLTAQQG